MGRISIKDEHAALDALNNLLSRLSGTESDLEKLKRFINALNLKSGFGEAAIFCAMPYRDYLKTDHWEEMRKKALAESKLRCRICNSSGELHTHHRSYKDIGHEQLSDLICLCKNCHEIFHREGKLHGDD